MHLQFSPKTPFFNYHLIFLKYKSLEKYISKKKEILTAKESQKKIKDHSSYV